ncbi:MAG TPA: hypothetical protein VKU87_08795 [Thermomicrobiaceae bacterium]|nr:hypothetical protein [Thermomicrobiaceae bacterium]
MTQSSVTFTIEPVEPYRLDLTAWILRRRPENILDLWDGATYRRALNTATGPVLLEVQQAGSSGPPTLAVTATGEGVAEDDIPLLRETVAAMLGTGVDLSGFERLAHEHPALETLVSSFRGAKPTRYPTIYEGLINAIVCQQITLTFGQRILGRLIEACGRPIDVAGQRYYAFPEPEGFLTMSPEALREIGFSRQKTSAAAELSQKLVDGTLDLETIRDLPDGEAVARLRELRGVGRWTAEYVLLRVLGRIHIFPGDDVGGRNNVQHWLGIEGKLDYDGIRDVLAAWGDYAGLLYFYTLLMRLDEKGSLS